VPSKSCRMQGITLGIKLSVITVSAQIG